MAIAHAALRRRFDVRTYVDRVIDDLRLVVPEFPELDTRDPIAFRSSIKAHLEEAVASQSLSVTYFAALRQVEACVSKLPAWGAVTDEVRRQRALDKFQLSERRCAIVNRRARWYRSHESRLRPVLRNVFAKTKLLLWQFLGDPLAFDDFTECKFGPGLAYGMSSEERHIYYKVSGDQTVTPEARKFALEVLSKLYPNWMQHLAASGKTLTVIPGNRITFVPKSAETFRTIAVEPSLNVFLQAGVDRVMRYRLREWGLRLNDQDYSVSAMERLARQRDCATIDLSAASDSVAFEVVQWLFPAEWVAVLNAIRSPMYTLDKGKTWTSYEKFSSMGNGTTFPLESALFYALAQACTQIAGGSKQNIRVYGDDIVVEKRTAGLLIEALSFLGFRTNTDKTFVFGRFHECCGVDIYDNVDVRPVYLRQVPKAPDEVANLHNRLLANRFGFRFEGTLEYLRDIVHGKLWGPSFFGFSGLTRDEIRDWYAGKSRQYAAFFFGAPAEKPRFHRGWQSLVWDIETWHRPSVPFEKVKHLSNKDRYMALLYGLGSIPYRQSNVLHIRQRTHSGEWSVIGETLTDTRLPVLPRVA